MAEGLEQEGQKVLTSVLCTPLGGSAQEFMREHLAPSTEAAEPYNLVLLRECILHIPLMNSFYM